MEIIPRLETPRPNLRAIFCLFVICRVGGTAVIDAFPVKLVNSAGKANCDGYDVFYDHGTEYCELCSEICQNAEVRGTQEQCRQNCPRYLRAMTCEEKEGWVYDQAEDSCRSCCGDVCDASKPDISLQCMRLCPDYFAGRTKASSPNSSSHGHGKANGPSSHRLPPCAENSTENPSHSSATEDAHAISIIIVIIAVILGVIVILFAFGIVFITPSKMRVLALRRVQPRESEGEADFNDRGEDMAIPIEESRAAAAEQPCLAVVTGDTSGRRSMTLRVLTAFADLSVGRNPSRLYQIV